MARIRSIKPDFFLDEDLAELKFEARLLFAGLWCLADKAGRLEDRPKRIKAQLFPYENVKVDAILNTLHPDQITRYSVSSCNYIQINGFSKHQRPHHTEKDSIIPECNGGGTVKTPLTDGDEKVGREGKGREIYCPCFETIWKKYPNKDGKKAAERHFDATVKTEHDFISINTALDKYLAHLAAQSWDKKPKNGSTWFNNWQDWVDWVEPNTNAGTHGSAPEGIT